MAALGVTAVMVVIECMEVGVSTIMKAAMTRGMSQFVYIVYSNALALVILLSSSFIFYRKRPLPQLTVSILLRIFLMGVISLQMFLNTGIRYSSPTMSSAMTDLTPAFTFLLALISRMEKLDMRLQGSQAKSVGTMLSVAGALTVTLYKGQPITGVPSQNSSIDESLQVLPSNWVIGGILCAAGALGISLVYVIQTWILKDYPSELMITVICCLYVTVLSVPVSLIAEKDPNAWILKPDVELIAIGCSAIFAVSLRSVVHAWVCGKKGPLYTAMFKPLGMIIATFLGVSFLGDTLYLGSVIGGIIIALGFYTVIWGKAQEEEKMVEEKGNSNFASCSTKAPLLQNRSVDV
ncbi:WAT1-related protein At5g40230 isoform X2 [Hevea brasiliensis]|uniref:WAT1-related protein At5g40230 isoform X2 n=1 Tax=Hevea brasiliensis TaxID=3981 RepID=UPI0025D2FE01|nr:WAT1-related protein At5g40230 isoform X2 [Hevea brasiliensis]